jgi:hypothetical protein
MLSVIAVALNNFAEFQSSFHTSIDTRLAARPHVALLRERQAWYAGILCWCQAFYSAVAERSSTRVIW